MNRKNGLEVDTNFGKNVKFFFRRADRRGHAGVALRRDRISARGREFEKMLW
jgi:hypothetical protein